MAYSFSLQEPVISYFLLIISLLILKIASITAWVKA
jgi:hypothetical protein